ncbi:molecular chaperone TorD family protein [Eggerthella guodeyinii]|uniref:Uncharacterized protein n=1 Tax=Eggerthella guodeyinii TaxID=2690837 RepID=A0A6N7RMX9_9ACTN|nr:molecular chaperone TorD family protein [Eggerthella guodeyinii]MRX82098.1 hypothetical protein [Eggerthella guodeyinii]
MEHKHTAPRERANTYATFASGLLNPPGDPKQEQAFLERLLVSNSPTFVPLSEQCIREAHCAEGRWRFGTIDGRHRRHVMRCYDHVSFDFRRLHGYPVLVQSLRADSLATECAFMAFLLAGVETVEVDEPTDGRIAFADAFLNAHLGLWVNDAARACASAGSDDHVTRTVEACATFVSSELATRTSARCLS